MVKTRQTIALAGVGDLGRYVCEGLLESSRFDIVILTRNDHHKSWFQHGRITTFSTDYTVPSILWILNSTLTTTMISFINIPDERYIKVHSALLAACQRSNACKRLIPSEWIGNVDAFPLKPDYYASTREPFRHMLRAQTEVEWTLFNIGWLADYFLPSAKTYMKPIPGKFPVDPNAWEACVRGTGDELQSWVCARDAAKAVVELCVAEQWEQTTYVAAEWSTFNLAVGVMEKVFETPLPLTRKPWEDSQRVLDAYRDKAELTDELELAQVEEMMVMSYLSCPKAKTLRQRGKYFPNIHFRTLEELLHSAKEMDFV